MSMQISPFRLRLERLLTSLGLGMRAKLIGLFVVIKVVPLILLALVAWMQAWNLGEELKARTEEIAAKAVAALSQTGEIAVSDAVSALDARATDEIERMTTDTARHVADFLYSRDDDILLAASLEPDEAVYRGFVERQKGTLIDQGEWELAPDGNSWRRKNPSPPPRQIFSSIEENNHSFNYRPPDRFAQVSRPLYLEMTFVDLSGQEKIKVTSSDRMRRELLNIADKRNTYVGAEDYFQALAKLKPGEIYVSDVIGEYVGTSLIGMYTPNNCRAKGVPFEPEKQAYAGKENPLGKRFRGLVRWATPVVRKGAVIGYVTLALDHDHIMEFTDHIVPTKDRYTEIPDAYEGNYAFIWDHKGRSIVHPRHHSICGYDSATGDPQVPWLEGRIYDDWQASGKSYVDFIKDAPVFVEQSNTKKPALPLTKAGLVALDCRYLNFAPQCTGWFDLTEDGGSGSFLILWSGLWKLNTAAAIPYYTGQYAKSLRGFGFVAIGAGLTDFHRPATETQAVLNALVDDTDKELARIAEDTFAAIGKNLWQTASSLSASTAVMAALVILIAIWLASIFTRSITRLISGISRFRAGERQFRFNSPIKDEIGALADSFDDMADSLKDSVKGPLSIVSLDRKMIYANDEALRVIGKTLADVVGAPYEQHSIYPKGSRYCPITALLSGSDTEVLYHAPSNRYLKGTASYLTDKNGQNIAYIVATTDLTDIITEQKHLEQQRLLLSTVFDASPDLIWYQDNQGKYLAANPRFAALLGARPDEVRGRTVTEFLPPEAATAMRENDFLAIDGAIPLYSEERLTFADGHQETLDVVRTPLYTPQGGFIGLLSVARDVSQRVAVENELRKTQLELKKAAAAANKASESKSSFLARMSHEIRTPMNAIIGMASISRRKLLDGTADKEEILAHVRQIETSSTHLLGLLNDILDISKIEAGKIELSEEIFRLDKLVDSVNTIIRPRCQEKNIAYTVDMEGMERGVFISDALRLRQVLINLLGNAVKFTPEFGAVTFHVRCAERAEGKSLIAFSVRDTGIGMSPKVQAALFTPFEQGDRQIGRLYGGTGLGLSISKSIVNLLGGDISVESAEGEGSEFSFSLWLTEADADPEAAAAGGDISTLSGKRALLVDDVDINRLIVMEQLAHTGLHIDEAADGREAVDIFSASPPGYYDIIFMDVQMPYMDGYEAADTIRALDRPDARAVPIIAMTANAFKEDVDAALAHGMNGHLAKPLEEDKLMDILLAFIGQQARPDI